MTDLFTQPTFDDWYVVFPKKKDRKDARKAYTAALKEVSPIVLQRAVEAYAAIWDELTGYQSKTGKDKIKALQFCKHPATWLRAGSWEDEDITEWLERPKPEDIPKPFKIYSDSPEGQAWMNYEIKHVNKFAKSHWIATAFMLRPSPFPPIKE